MPSTSLSDPRRATLAALAARLIPGDASSPGAVEAGVPDFVVSQLAEYFPAMLEQVEAGLDALDGAAKGTAGQTFTELLPEPQDELLAAVEAESWFELVLQLSIDGFLCDPRHGGNRDLVGWRLVGYPGVTMAPSEADQQLGRRVAFHGTTLADWQRNRQAAG